MTDKQMRPARKAFVLAIDGGAATGKSSTARALAARFNLLHVDTGSHYRAVTLALSQAGVAPVEGPALEAALKGLALGVRVEGLHAQVEVNAQVPAPEALRSPEVNANVSHFAALAAVREFLRQYQRGHREVATQHGLPGLVMEGRDIGSVIFPEAPLRFFLEADEARRNERRRAEGQTDQVGERDRMDASRLTAPLKCPDGATRIDNSELSLEQVVERIAGQVDAWLQAEGGRA